MFIIFCAYTYISLTCGVAVLRLRKKLERTKMRHQAAMAALFSVFIGGCTIPYKIPLRAVEVNTEILNKNSKDNRSFAERVAALAVALVKCRDTKTKMNVNDAFSLFGVEKMHFRELPQAEVKKNLSLPENITSGWTTEQTVKFAERIALFKGYVFTYTDAKKGGYIGFPKLSTKQEGIDAQIIIIADTDDVFNIITPGGPVFPEKQSTYWWEIAQDYLRGFVGEGGKETIRQGKKLF